MPSRYFEMNVNYFRSNNSIAMPLRRLPILALFGHATPGPACPLLRDDRTQLKRVPTSVDDPSETLDAASSSTFERGICPYQSR